MISYIGSETTAEQSSSGYHDLTINVPSDCTYVVLVGRSPNHPYTLDNPTINGVSTATLYDYSVAGYIYKSIAMRGLANPSTGSQTLRVYVNGYTVQWDVLYFKGVLGTSNVGQTNGNGTQSISTSTGVSTSFTPNHTDSLIVGALVWDGINNNSLYPSQSGMTTVIDDSYVGQTRGLTGYNIISSGGTKTITYSWSSQYAATVCAQIEIYAAPSGPANIKTFNGLATASTKTVNGLAIGSVKSKNGLT